MADFPANAEKVRIRWYDFDDDGGGSDVAVTFTPSSTKLLDVGAHGWIRPKIHVVKPDPSTGFAYVDLIGGNDPDHDPVAYRVEIPGVDPFVIVPDINAATVTYPGTFWSSAVTLPSQWLTDMTATNVQPPSPVSNFYTSAQTDKQITTGIGLHNADTTAHPDIRQAVSSAITTAAANAGKVKSVNGQTGDVTVQTNKIVSGGSDYMGAVTDDAGRMAMGWRNDGAVEIPGGTYLGGARQRTVKDNTNGDLYAIVDQDGKSPLIVRKSGGLTVNLAPDSAIPDSLRSSTEVASSRGSRTAMNDRLNAGLNQYGFPRDYMAQEWYLRWTRMMTRKLMLGDAGTQFDIACIGDSYSQFAARWTGPFWQTMKNQLGDAGVGWVGFAYPAGSPTLINGSVRPIDTSVAVSGSWTPVYAGQYGPDMGQMTSSTANDTITVTFAAGQTSATLYYVGGSSGATASYAWGSGAATSLDLSGGTGLQTVALNAPAATDTKLTFTVTGGSVTLCGVDLRNKANGVRVHKIASTGSAATDWAKVDPSWKTGLQTIKPQLVFVFLATNDQIRGASTQTFTTAMSTVLGNVSSALGTSADVAVVMPAENQKATGVPMPQLSAAMQPLAYQYGAAFLDMQYMFGENPADYAAGSSRPWYSSDQVHPDPFTGGRVMADAIYRMVMGR